MRSIFFVRHGQSTGNANGILQGTIDFGLTPKGCGDAARSSRALRERTRQSTRIISSPLKRARQTAGILSEELNLPIVIDACWTEVSLGVMDGKRLDDIYRISKSSNPKDWIGRFRNSEPAQNIRSRILHGVQKLSHEDIVVSHGLLGAYLMSAIGQSDELNFEIFHQLQGDFLEIDLPSSLPEMEQSSLEKLRPQEKPAKRLRPRTTQ